MIWDVLEKKVMNAGLAFPGDTLFRHTMHAELSKGVMFRNSLNGIPYDPYLPGFHKAPLQGIVRHTDPVKGNKLAQDVLDAIVTHVREEHPANEERGRLLLHNLYPISLPIQYPRLEGNGFEWSLNIRCTFTILGLP